MGKISAVVYGIDTYTEFVVDSIRNNVEIVGISDSFSDIEFWGDYKFIPKKLLNSVCFDYLIITGRERRIKNEIEQDLLAEGISKDKIISFFEIFQEEKIDKVMKLHPEKIYDGVIIGLSHAEKGLLPRYFDGEWVNLATSAEDFFNHYEVLKRCFEEYSKSFSALKYVVIDLYDYTNFLYNTSLSAQALSYWADGGIYLDNEYANNKILSSDKEAEMNRRLGNYPAYFPKRTEKEYEIRKLLFNEEAVYEKIGNYFTDVDPAHLGYNDVPCELQNRGHISDTPMIPVNAYLRDKRDSKIYEETEKKNEKLFYSLIDYIREKSPGTKIVLTLLPRFSKMEQLHNENTYLIEEKRKFEERLKRVTDDRMVFFKDFKDCTKISSNHFFYRDVSHLNYQGAVAMSTELNRYLRSLEKE